MSTAISEILKQAAPLSPAEQLELATKLVERARQHGAALENGYSNEVVIETASAEGAERAAKENEEEGADEEWLDVFSLNRVPPQRTYVMKVKYVDGGRGLPRRYDFGDLFAEEEKEEEGAA